MGKKNLNLPFKSNTTAFFKKRHDNGKEIQRNGTLFSRRPLYGRHLWEEWTEEDLNQAFQLILKESRNANFDTLMKNLEHYPELYQLVFSVIFDGEAKQFSEDDPTVNLGVLHGIFAESESGHVVIQNRIYRERIANMMVSKWHTSQIEIGKAHV